MEQFTLWDNIPELDNVKTEKSLHMDFYPADNGKGRGTVIILPGGGYGHHAAHEGEPIAKWLNGLGINAFVLYYRIAPHKHPSPIMDALRGIRIARKNAERLQIKKDKIAVLGFSAGGHLASTTATQYDREEYNLNLDDIDKESSRPDAVILCYPVISTNSIHAHSGSAANLLGENASMEKLTMMSSEKNINEKSPPAFLWHTANDAAVPVANSLLYAQACSDNKVPFELHVYPDGPHGLGILNEEYKEVCESWSHLCGVWLVNQGY